jgi:hypothetical protein
MALEVEWARLFPSIGTNGQRDAHWAWAWDGQRLGLITFSMGMDSGPNWPLEDLGLEFGFWMKVLGYDRSSI